MKALILAAGLGTRLRPHTRKIPKPLFPMGGRPLVDIHIEALEKAGCAAVVVNTHHLAPQIENHIKGHRYNIPVHTRNEPEILGTGGAIKNLEGFWDDEPFLVINSDIFSDIDPAAVYRFHLNHPHPATMVLCDWPEINTVCVDGEDLILGFKPGLLPGRCRHGTFTGIQVLDPEILQYIPRGVFSSSINAFLKMMADGKKIKAYMPDRLLWTDIGTPDRYVDTAAELLSKKAFRKVFDPDSEKPISRKKLQGDGSDRKWYRLTTGQHGMVMASHGIQTEPPPTEFDAFVAIGRHLHSRGIPVPEIYLYDRFSGLVILEDLGQTHLQSLICNTANRDVVVSRYREIIDLLVKMSTSGAVSFNPAWTYQSAEYDLEMILEKECRYFVDAFLNTYCRLDLSFGRFKDEFISLSEKALKFAVSGFMHRDFQSRNIMIKENRPYFIDFQGGRRGPVQYDLASLLIDPYVELSESIRIELAAYCAEKMSTLEGIDTDRFITGYGYCCITRNLQILGAFGFLSRVKNKPFFEEHIPAAIRTLVESVNPDEFPGLASVAGKIHGLYGNGS
jgi:NDP-sugar pyrophosphorylase family protein/tRNA A-37 threonylcarbamoyl transferase component Bud32